MERLRQASDRKRDEARAKANRALMALEAEGTPINFRTVAAAAGVSTDFLYSHRDLADRIKRSRAAPSNARPVPVSERPSAKSAAVQLSVVQASNQALRNEVAQLRDENARLRGELLKLRASHPASRSS